MSTGKISSKRTDKTGKKKKKLKKNLNLLDLHHKAAESKEKKSTA